VGGVAVDRGLFISGVEHYVCTIKELFFFSSTMTDYALWPILTQNEF
jgi:hypothetical protein